MPLEIIDELRAHATAVTVALRAITSEYPKIADVLRDAANTSEAALQAMPVPDEFIASVVTQLRLFSGDRKSV